MRRGKLLGVAGLALAFSPSLVPCESVAAQASDLEAALFRTRRAADVTVVDGIVQFDPALVANAKDCAYRLNVKVRDAARTLIFEDSWMGVVGCESAKMEELKTRGARVVETFRFGVAEGRYSVELALTPEGNEDMTRRLDFEFESLPATAIASDLILARQVGRADSTEDSHWTIRKGELGIVADPFHVADPEHPRLAYYMELYPTQGSSLEGGVEGIIRRPDGEPVVRFDIATLEGTAVSRPVAGAVSLAGLPPGDYAFELRLDLADTVITRSRGFRMSGFSVPLEAGKAADRLARYFASLSDEELAELFDAVVVWLGTASERKAFAGLNANGKRRFLTYYFRERAPEQLGGGERALEIYLERVRFVQQEFAEKTGKDHRAGWRTDQGRVYLLRGEPDDRQDRRFPRENSPPHIIWSYDVEGRFVYLFVDETRFKNYRLIFSTDPVYPPLPDWQRRAGEQAIDALVSYFGIRF